MKVFIATEYNQGLNRVTHCEVFAERVLAERFLVLEVYCKSKKYRDFTPKEMLANAKDNVQEKLLTGTASVGGMAKVTETLRRVTEAAKPLCYTTPTTSTSILAMLRCEVHAAKDLLEDL